MAPISSFKLTSPSSKVEWGEAFPIHSIHLHPSITQHIHNTHPLPVVPFTPTPVTPGWSRWGGGWLPLHPMAYSTTPF